MKYIRCLFAVGLLFSAAAAVPAAHSSEDMMSFSVGYYDILDNKEAVDLRAEYRWGEPLIWQVRPFVGVEGTTNGALYGLGGIYFDWGIAPHVYLTPSFGAGLYSDGGGKDLGNTVEFRSQLEAAYEFSNAHRVGVSFGHISNASLGDSNPGTEILSLYYHIPVGSSAE